MLVKSTSFNHFLDFLWDLYCPLLQKRTGIVFKVTKTPCSLNLVTFGSSKLLLQNGRRQVALLALQIESILRAEYGFHCSAEASTVLLLGHGCIKLLENLILRKKKSQKHQVLSEEFLQPTNEILPL